MKKIIAFLLAFVASIAPAHAHCPLCTGAIGAAAVSAKYYGVDSSIIGLLVGAFGISTGLWVGRAVKKQYFKYQTHAIVLASFLLTVVPLRFISTDNIYIPMLFFGEPGSMFNRIYWVDRLLFGSMLGALVCLGAFALHNYAKRVNRNKVFFPYQGIVFSVGLLAVVGIALYFILG